MHKSPSSLGISKDAEMNVVKKLALFDVYVTPGYGPQRTMSCAAHGLAR